MSVRFWLFSVASAGAALAGGLSLGLYATTPPRAAISTYDDSSFVYEERQTATQDLRALNGPQEVKCTGCGPTLAERQYYAAPATWNGYDDPMVQDYDAQEPNRPEDLLTDARDHAPPQVHQLPENIDPFANGDTPAPHPMRIVQGVPAAPGRFQPSIAIP